MRQTRALLGALQTGSPELRTHTAWLLGKIGAPAGSAVATLAQAASNSDERLRAEATVALKRITVEK